YSSGKPLDYGLIQDRAIELGYSIDLGISRQVRLCYTTTANAEANARNMHKESQNRQAAAVGLELAYRQISPLEGAGKLQEILKKQNYSAASPEEMANELADYLFREDSEPPFLSTGYCTLDNIFSGGFVHGGLYVFAARTNVGKTNIAINISERVAAQGKHVLYFSLEMPRKDINIRRIGILKGLNTAKVKNKMYIDDEKKGLQIMQALNTISERRIRIYDIPATLDEIEREVRCYDDLDLIVIDHIGIIAPVGEMAKMGPYQLMTNISHRLKRLALSTGTPILALCQLNREVEKQNREPILSDLRDSGAIEEDSDAVCLMHRESLGWPEEQRPKANEPDTIKFLIKKNRHGATGSTTMEYYGINSRITEEVQNK
ncbi:MAG: AAA family ATPase, partial [Oscillospiraceae bacterium]|nr:AAA family ATPase [Oscillospiraceae bacterium]